MRNNIAEIQKAFGEQAAGFNGAGYHLSKAEYTDYMVKRTNTRKTDKLLEVAAGTCICGRAFAPQVAQVTCLDATPAMLEVGKEESEKAGIDNITFVKGVAEELPFLDNSFDIVISRLAFHHFVNPNEIFAEMKRVLKPGGKLVLMDMTVEKEELREEVDRIEQMRDFSHVRDLSREEMLQLYKENGMTVSIQEQIDIPVVLERWMDLTHTPQEKRAEITALMEDDLAGKAVTGFAPYRKDGKIYFNHHWVFNLGKKNLKCFNETEIDNPKFPKLSRRAKFLKESEGGMMVMCDVMEEYMAEERKKFSILIGSMIKNNDSDKIEQLQNPEFLQEMLHKYGLE